MRRSRTSSSSSSGSRSSKRSRSAAADMRPRGRPTPERCVCTTAERRDSVVTVVEAEAGLRCGLYVGWLWALVDSMRGLKQSCQEPTPEQMTDSYSAAQLRLFSDPGDARGEVLAGPTLCLSPSSQLMKLRPSLKEQLTTVVPHLGLPLICCG